MKRIIAILSVLGWTIYGLLGGYRARAKATERSKAIVEATHDHQ